jgi:hypothetical protein
MNAKEKLRIESNKEKILNKLREAGDKGVLNTEMSEICLRYGAVISNLHIAGYEITNESVNGGVRKYVLVNEPDEEPKPKKATEVLMDEITQKHQGIVYDFELEELLEKLNLTVVRKSGTHTKKRSA